MSQLKLQLEEGKNLIATLDTGTNQFQISEAEINGIGSEAGADPAAGNNGLPESPAPEYVDPGSGQNFDVKTGVVGGIITILTMLLPILLKLIEGANISEIVAFVKEILPETKWILGGIGAIYLLRETVQGIQKHWTTDKLIEIKADPNLKNVEIKKDQV